MRDATPDVLADYAGRYGGDRFRRERHPNMGQPSTINRGYELATGDILGILNSDDWLLPGAVRIQVDALEADPNGVGALLRRALYERIGGWDPAYITCPDYEFYLRAGPTLKHIVVPEVVAAVRTHADNITLKSAGLTTFRDRLRLLDALFAEFDTAPMRLSRSAQRLEQLQLPRRQFETGVLNRQLQVHTDIIHELEETVRVQQQALDHLEAAVADRDTQLTQLAQPPQPNGSGPPPSTPSWWKSARRLTPSRLRHRLGVLAHRHVLPRVNGRSGS
jgi:hypothetical protein